MLHFIRFAAGVVTGVVALTLIRNKNTQASLQKADDKLREAAANTFQTVKKASERVRSRFASDAKEPSEKSDEVTPDGKENTAAHKRSAKTAAKHDNVKDGEG